MYVHTSNQSIYIANKKCQFYMYLPGSVEPSNSLPCNDWVLWLVEAPLLIGNWTFCTSNKMECTYILKLLKLQSHNKYVLVIS